MERKGDSFSLLSLAGAPETLLGRRKRYPGVGRAGQEVIVGAAGAIASAGDGSDRPGAQPQPPASRRNHSDGSCRWACRVGNPAEAQHIAYGGRGCPG